MEGGKAEIDMDVCIRCGKCHDICPTDAVRHDSERITSDIRNNVDMVNKNMSHYTSTEEKRAFLERMINHFKREIKIAERSAEETKALYERLGDDKN